MRCVSLLLVSPPSLIDVPRLYCADNHTIGACGLVGYPLVGIHKEIRNIKITDKDRCPADLVRKLGEAEYANATESDKLYVVRVWCQTMMHVRLV
jgi:hypothetical protein